MEDTLMEGLARLKAAASRRYDSALVMWEQAAAIIAERERFVALLEAVREHLAVTDDVSKCDITNARAYQEWSARSAAAWDKLRQAVAEIGE